MGLPAGLCVKGTLSGAIGGGWVRVRVGGGGVGGGRRDEELYWEL